MAAFRTFSIRSCVGESGRKTRTSRRPDNMRDREPASLTVTDGDSLRVDLFWQHDRYSHRIVAVLSGREIPVIESVDGTDKDAWPPSPPLQQLSIEELAPGRQVALLVGMAGKSHWSVSIEPQPEQRGFVFDVACRSRDVAHWLGSTYRGLEDKVPVPGFRLSGLEVDRGRTSVQQHEVEWMIRPAQTDRATSGTRRWKYGVSLP